MTLRCVDPICLDGPADGDQPMPRWADAPGLLCRKDAEKLEQRLAELESRRDALRSVLGGGPAGAKGGNRPTKGSPPIPLNISAHDHLTAMQAVVVSWVRMVCEERGLRGPDGSDVALLARWLLSQLDWLLEHPAVGDLCDEMRDLARVADGLTQVHPRWNRLDPACPTCGAQELGRMDGDEHVACRACGRQWHEREYPAFVRLALDESGGSCTAAEGAERAGVPAATFRQWVSRKKVRRLGTVDGLARYSTEDVDRMTQDIEEAS